MPVTDPIRRARKTNPTAQSDEASEPDVKECCRNRCVAGSLDGDFGNLISRSKSPMCSRGVVENRFLMFPDQL